MLGIGNEAVSCMGRGLAMLTVARLVELAEIFGCDAADLLAGASTRSSDQGKYVGQLLAKISGNDRAMVVEIVRQRLAIMCDGRRKHPRGVQMGVESPEQPSSRSLLSFEPDCRRRDVIARCSGRVDMPYPGHLPR
jgi:hypothetical protein